MKSTRRDFVKSALATTAACGLARLSLGNDAAAADSIIDTHVYIGHWPFRRTAGDDPNELAATLRQNQAEQAWVGSFDGLFHKDIGAVNERLADGCSRFGGNYFKPFGTVNPTLPDWEEDVRRCRENFHMPGIRLHPNYHGYTLDDPRFTRLLALATSYNLIVQLVVWIDHEHQLLLHPLKAQVDLGQLAKAVRAQKGLRLIVASGADAGRDEMTQTSLAESGVFFDIGCIPSKTESQSWPMNLLPKRCVFGSCAPLHRIEDALATLQAVKLPDRYHRAIANSNVKNLLKI